MATRYTSGSHELRLRLTKEQYDGVRWSAAFTNSTMNQVVSNAIDTFLSTTGAYQLATTANAIEDEHDEIIKRIGGVYE